MRQKRKKHYTINFILLLLTAAGILILVMTTLQRDTTSSQETMQQLPTASDVGVPPPEETATATPVEIVPTPSPSPNPSPTPQYNEAVWIAVGDVMMHKPQLPGSYDKKTKKYSFDSYFTDVKPILADGDWVMANLETPVAGPAYGYTGYPSFNAPIELLEGLQKAGFNILTTANNHSLDKGEKGLLLTLKHIKELNIPFKGTAATQEEADSPVIIDQNGIKMGVLSYTYGTNGIPLPKGKPYMVSLIEENKIIEDIQKTKQAGADFVTVALHFGTEYQTKPNEEQKRLARKLVAEGADIIAGSHPHVIQPYEVLEATDSNGEVRRGLIIYSMGNFISNQREDTKDYGVIFKVLIRKNMTDNTIELREIESIPTWVHRYKPDAYYRYRILPVEETIEASSDTLLSQADYTSLKNHLKLLRSRLDSMLTKTKGT
ncbi:MAG: CapA family protein [Candidatus Pristimantibacillus sp.]